MEKVRRAGIYVRMLNSRKGQEEFLGDCVKKCVEYCSRREYAIEESKIYYETNSVNDEQPVLKRLLEGAESQNIEVLVVTAPGMLSSSPSSVFDIVLKFQSYGTSVETAAPSFLDEMLKKPRIFKQEVVPVSNKKQVKSKKRDAFRKYNNKSRSRWTEFTINGPAEITKQNQQRRVAIYVRSDELELTKNPDAIKKQLSNCKSYCRKHSFILDEKEFYIEKTTDELNRPELDRLLKAARSHTIDIVVLNNVQNFSKKPSHLAFILDALKKEGVRVDTVD